MLWDPLRVSISFYREAISVAKSTCYERFLKSDVRDQRWDFPHPVAEDEHGSVNGQGREANLASNV
jgi:hypothetical protein